MNDPYISPDGVLRNRLGITDSSELEAAEADIAAARENALRRRRVRGEYDLAHLRAFLKQLSADVGRSLVRAGLDPGQNEAASVAGFRGDLEPLIVMLDKHVLREG